MSPRHCQERIQDILDEIGKIRSFTDSIDFETFKNDEKTQHAVRMSLIIIGEAGNAVPEEIQERFLDVPWNLIRAMRNRLVHVYFNFDDQMVWDTIKNDVPLLEKAINNTKL